MAENKKQHYVPRMYIKRFTEDEKIYLYNVETKTNIGQVPYKNICQEDYFYGKNLQNEKYLSNKESEWNKSIDEIINGNHSDENISNIKEFAIFQKQRTLGSLENFNTSIKEILENTVMFGLEKKAYDIQKYKNLIDDKCQEEANDAIDTSFMLDMAKNTIQLIDDLSFLHIKYNTNKKLISSDNPIIVINPYLKYNFGFSMIGLIFLFPISPKDLVVLYDHKIYSKYSDAKYIENSNQSEVNHINSYELINANEIIYSNCEFPKTLFDISNFLERDKTNESNVQRFGTEDQQIIHWRSRGIVTDKNLSFARIENKYKNIDFKYRDSVPRKYEKAYDDKEKILCSVISDVVFNDCDNYYGNSKTKYIAERNKYYNLIKEYWDNN